MLWSLLADLDSLHWHWSHSLGHANFGLIEVVMVLLDRAEDGDDLPLLVLVPHLGALLQQVQGLAILDYKHDTD